MTWPLPPFLWGVATSAYQIEGGIDGNDWADWERLPGKVRDGGLAGEACGSWEHWARDLDRIQALEHQVYDRLLERTGA